MTMKSKVCSIPLQLYLKCRLAIPSCVIRVDQLLYGKENAFPFTEVYAYSDYLFAFPAQESSAMLPSVDLQNAITIFHKALLLRKELASQQEKKVSWPVGLMIMESTDFNLFL